jgi:hypothetical protein
MMLLGVINQLLETCTLGMDWDIMHYPLLLPILTSQSSSLLYAGEILLFYFLLNKVILKTSLETVNLIRIKAVNATLVFYSATKERLLRSCV